MYAAFGTTALFQDAGFEAHIVAAVMFWRSSSQGPGKARAFKDSGLAPISLSHFWVEVDDTIVDVGPRYLPDDSRAAKAITTTHKPRSSPSCASARPIAFGSAHIQFSS
jgi:hypothetical protein